MVGVNPCVPVPTPTARTESQSGNIFDIDGAKIVADKREVNRTPSIDMRLDEERLLGAFFTAGVRE